MNLEFIRNNLKRLLDDIRNIKEKNNIKHDIKLVAVSKTFPVEYIKEAYNAGQKVFGENRVQEAEEKINILKNLDIEWHLVGVLQKNKVNKAVPLFDLIHSIDSFELAQKVSKKAIDINKVQDILIQVNTSGESTKSGFKLDYSLIRDEVAKILELKGVRVRGFMTIGPLTDDRDLIKNSFKQLREMRDSIQKELKVDLIELSMGMSSDYDIAILEGATIIRVGSLIFGKRS